MSKDYHDCKWLYLGDSDIAQIVLRTNNGAKTVFMAIHHGRYRQSMTKAIITTAKRQAMP